MRIGTSFMVACLLIAGPLSAQSESPANLLATRPVQFASWQPAAMRSDVPGAVPAQLTPLMHRRGRNALLGAGVGAVAGIVFCTVVSNLINDPGSGFSTCTLKGYLLTGGVGLAAGLVIGLIA